MAGQNVKGLVWVRLGEVSGVVLRIDLSAHFCQLSWILTD